MASSLARAVSAMHRLSMDTNRDKSQQFVDSPLTRDGSGGLAPSSSYSDELHREMSVGDEDGNNLYDTSADDFGVIKETFQGTAFIESPHGNSRSFAYNSSTNVACSARDLMHHAHSLPPDCLPKVHRREGSEHSQSNPVAIPTATVESLATCDLDNDEDSRGALSAPLPSLSRSLYAMMTTPRAARRRSMQKDPALEYFEFADVMRSF